MSVLRNSGSTESSGRSLGYGTLLHYNSPLKNTYPPGSCSLKPVALCVAVQPTGDSREARLHSGLSPVTHWGGHADSSSSLFRACQWGVGGRGPQTYCLGSRPLKSPCSHQAPYSLVSVFTYTLSHSHTHTPLTSHIQSHAYAPSNTAPQTHTPSQFHISCKVSHLHPFIILHTETFKISYMAPQFHIFTHTKHTSHSLVRCTFMHHTLSHTINTLT